MEIQKFYPVWITKLLEHPAFQNIYFLFKLLFRLTIFGQANEQHGFVNFMVCGMCHKSSSAFFGKTKRQSKKKNILCPLKDHVEEV